ncbi:MAG: CAF17-like 4Fe-4S cluster assembly/insertion protein YgfZ, partial [Longimicrobiales bacterium]
GSDESNHESPLLSQLESAGGIVGDYHGRRLVRHFGDPQAEYQAATNGMAVFDRSHRARLTVSGRAPGQMLNGVLTGRMPSEPLDVGDSVREGLATYHAVLTPKGKLITDLVALLPGAEDETGLLLDVPVAGRDGLLAHFGKFLPPRFAKTEDVSDATASISVVGPKAAEALSKLALGLRVDADWLQKSEEGAWRAVGSAKAPLLVVRTMEVWPEAWTVYGPSASVSALWKVLVQDGGQPAGLGVWSTLRVEAGRPVFGLDMDAATLPPEAGIVERAIDQTKGCYTGQEVIVRIRDRGHVNKALRRLELGDVPAPPEGTELLAPDGSGKVVGEIRSAVQSPRFGGTIALAYIRRGVAQVLLNDTAISVPDGFPES